MKDSRLRAGDQVLVRSPEEILSTLDADGTLGGLPFLPEMLSWCGRSVRVERRVEKTCVSVAPPVPHTRRFAADDVVVLEDSRCDGQAHDGCKRGCKIFWKEAWLRPMDASAAPAASSGAGLGELRRRLKVKSGPDRYFCQSTELCKATEPFPGKQKLWTLRIAFREIRNGDLSVSAVSKMFVLWFWQKLRRAMVGERWLRGPHKRTPSVALGLKPGEVVRIKSRAQVVETLDDRRRNRGMGICHEVTRCCEAVADVRYRVDRIIDERTGAMQEIRDTVALKNMRHDPKLGEECLCFDELGDCPRGELMYWREIWLERVSEKRDSAVVESELHLTR
jgi:hypothetical protein